MHGRSYKQYIFRSCDIYFQSYVFCRKSFQTPVRKIQQKIFFGLVFARVSVKTRSRVSNFALLWVVFKLHYGSKGLMINLLALFRCQ